VTKEEERQGKRVGKEGKFVAKNYGDVLPTLSMIGSTELVSYRKDFKNEKRGVGKKWGRRNEGKKVLISRLAFESLPK